MSFPRRKRRSRSRIGAATSRGVDLRRETGLDEIGTGRFPSIRKHNSREKTMKGHVSWVNELAVKDGALESFRELMEEMVSGASNEPGTLAYEWYISHDGSAVHVVETYEDSAAVRAHHVS